MLSDEQRSQRNLGIGGSDMAIILGLSSYKSAYQLYLEKAGFIETTFEQTPNQEWGNRLEPVIRNKFAELNEVDILAPTADEQFSPPCKRVKYDLDTIVHPLYDFMRANLDGFIPSLNAVLETKCSNSFMAGEWGEDGTDFIPMQYLVQVAHYVSCTNADKAIIAVLIGGYDYREFTYHRDLALESSIIQSASDFWEAVQTKKPPPPSRISDFKLMYPKPTDGKIIASDLDSSEAIKEIFVLRQKKEELEKLEESCKFKLMEYMKDCECLVDENGKTLATWKSDKRGIRSFKPKELK